MVEAGKMDCSLHILGKGHRIAPADPRALRRRRPVPREKIVNGRLASGAGQLPSGTWGEEIGLTLVDKVSCEHEGTWRTGSEAGGLLLGVGTGPGHLRKSFQGG